MVDLAMFHDPVWMWRGVTGHAAPASETHEVQGGYAVSEGMLHSGEMMSCGLRSKEVACQCVLSYNDTGLRSASALHDAVSVRSQPRNAGVLGCRGTWVARETLNCGVLTSAFLLYPFARERGREGLVVSNGNGGLSSAGI